MSPEHLQGVRSGRRRLWLFAGLWAFIFAVLLAFRAVVMPFAAAALVAYLVAPLVARITMIRVGKRSVPRWVAILTIYAGFFSLLYLGAVAFVPQLYRELSRISLDAVRFANSLTPERLDDISANAQQWLIDRGFPLGLSSRSLEGEDSGSAAFNFSIDLERLMREAVDRTAATLKNRASDLLGLSRRVLTSVFAGIFMLFFMLMVAAFFSIDVVKIKAYCRTLLPHEYEDDARVLIQRIDRSLSGVVRGQVTICLVNGVLTFIGLLLFGVKFAFLLATLATFFSLIPIFGTIISSVPIVLIGLSQSWKIGLAALLWIIGIHALEAYFLNPKIMGSAARIHPVVVAFALIAGERTWGLVGALFAVPLAAILVACFDFAREKAQVT